MSYRKRAWTGLFGATVGIVTALYVSCSQAATVELPGQEPVAAGSYGTMPDGRLPS